MEHKNTRTNRAESPEPVDGAASERLDRFACAALSTLKLERLTNYEDMAILAVAIAKAAIKEIDNV
jgi:hypothetical protein